jgi:cytochrome b pre-mRNA-processing protein 3
MQLIQRLFTRAPSGPDPRDSLRPLWHRVVEIARNPAFYRDDGVADTIAGRFDMITAVLSVVLLRMERDRVLTSQTALLTELFVEDMDGQLRESGVGDVVVGKHVGRLVSVLGGRLGALRDALRSRDDVALETVLARNVTMADGRCTTALAKRLRALADGIAALDSKTLLAGSISP